MYVAPRPRAADDPWFAVRLAAVATAGFVVGVVLQSPMVTLFPVLALSFTAGLRGAFNPRRALLGPIMFAVVMWIMSGLVTMLANFPLLLTGAMGLLYFAAYMFILRTGNPLGMLIAIAGVLMSTLEMSSHQGMVMLRDEMTKAAIFAALFLPFAYTLFPTVTGAIDEPVYAAAPGERHGMRALIRSAVLLLYSFYLYSVLDATSMMLAVSAAMVLTFPTRETLFAQARERSWSTIIGGLAGMALLVAFGAIAQLPVMLVLFYLAILLFGHLMMTGRHPPMVYQYAGSVLITLVTGALASREPTNAYLLRVTQTAIGAVGAAFLTALLESILAPGDAEAAHDGLAGEKA